jgi:DNA-binding transcriptional MerR regulator
MHDVSYSIAEASDRCGLSPRQIRYLEQRGWIKPGYIKIGGTHQRRFSCQLVKQLSEIAKLRREGFELEAAVTRVGAQCRSP